MAKLNPKQTRFISEYLIDRNGTQAAIRAGYSPKTARVQASDLLLKPDIAQAVAQKAQTQLEKVDITSEYILKGIKEIADNRESSESGRLKAYELLGKYRKLFTDKIEVTGKLTLEQLVESSLE